MFLSTFLWGEWAYGGTLTPLLLQTCLQIWESWLRNPGS